jgi:hypothetical protein
LDELKQFGIFPFLLDPFLLIEVLYGLEAIAIDVYYLVGEDALPCF